MESTAGMLPYERWIGGGAAHLQTFAGELGPAAQAQRKLFKQSTERMRTGGFGFTQGQRQQFGSSGRQAVAAGQAQQQADLARAQAAGQLQGGAAAEAQRQVAAQAQAANAQIEGQIQNASDQYAQQQYAQDEARIDAQAQRWRDLWNRQANISMQTTQGQDSYVAPAPKKKKDERPLEARGAVSDAPSGATYEDY